MRITNYSPLLSGIIAIVLMLVIVAIGRSSPKNDSPFASQTIHVGVVVSDLPASLAFYEHAIGMQRVSSFDIDPHMATRLGLTDSLSLHVEVLKLENQEDATQWKLMTFGDRAQQQENAYIHDRVGMQYITIYVKDLHQSIERLQEANIPLLGETPVALANGNHFVLVQDPDDNFVELIGPME